MPGESAADALAAAVALRSAGIRPIFTRLGENVLSLEEARQVADHYLDLYDRIVEQRLDGEISVKPTQLGLDIDRAATERHLDALAARADATGSFLWLDMEDSSYTDVTIEVFERLRDTHERTGICLQSYLRRTAADVERLLPRDPAIRLVKGAYDEPPDIAFRDRREVDANYLALAVSMLRAGRSRVRLGLGTHDVALVEAVAQHAEALGLGRDGFEVEMLYGIRARDQRRLVESGFRVQVLISYGSAWYAWYVRRLAERPANIVFALRQLLP